MKNWLVRVVLVVTALGACGAVQARYLQSDPIGLHGGFNPFIYRDANPLIYADPLGLLISSTVGGVRHGTTLIRSSNVWRSWKRRRRHWNRRLSWRRGRQRGWRRLSVAAADPRTYGSRHSEGVER